MAALLQAIGLAAAQKALTSGQPWRGLEAAANQCRPLFQLVLPAEPPWLQSPAKTRSSKGLDPA